MSLASTMPYSNSNSWVSAPKTFKTDSSLCCVPYIVSCEGVPEVGDLEAFQKFMSEHMGSILLASKQTNDEGATDEDEQVDSSEYEGGRYLHARAAAYVSIVCALVLEDHSSVLLCARAGCITCGNCTAG